MNARAQYEAAKIAAPYADESLVARLTQEVVASGHRVLQIFRCAGNDAAHIGHLLDWFDPPHGATVLDAGCGIGEVSKHMRAIRPDLSFISLNISPTQLGYFEGMRVAADFHRMPVVSRSVDAVMFAYSMGHGILEPMLLEAARVTRPGGILFIYDLASEDSAVLIRELGYKAHSPEDVIAEAVKAGFMCDLAFMPQASPEDFFDLMDRSTFDRVFYGIIPAVYRFIRN